jgi:uncharacterized protein
MRTILPFICVLLVLQPGCGRERSRQQVPSSQPSPAAMLMRPFAADSAPELEKLVAGAVEQVGITTGYDPSYVGIAYPGGDVPRETGVCSDVVVRAFRKAGIDLQKEVHEDMVRARAAYPKKWGNGGPDTNIDHRRVLNLMTFFARRGKSVSISSRREDYRPGDIVTWDLGNGIDHVGIVTNRLSTSEQHPLIAHNIGAGARLEDVLFQWKITGHYRYF